MSGGFIVGTQCVDAAAAVDLYNAQIHPVVFTSGASSYFVQAAKTSTAWMLETYQDGTLLMSSVLPSPALPACDTAQTFQDGMTLGWAVAAAMIVVFVIRRVYR